jgi:hypothetical protein
MGIGMEKYRFTGRRDTAETAQGDADMVTDTAYINSYSFRFFTENYAF